MNLQRLRPLSRSRIELFLQCPRCFYLQERFHIRRPSSPPFTLNQTVDALLKREFDRYRQRGEVPPLLAREGIEAVPYHHPDLPRWRDSRRGIRFSHTESGFEVYGAIDDVWITPQHELIVVDYKATSKETTPRPAGQWGEQYKRQLEVYQWLFRQNGFTVHPVAYLLYVNAVQDRPSFEGRLEFEEILIPHEGDLSWIEPTLLAMRALLEDATVPNPHPECAFCQYRNRVRTAFRTHYYEAAKKDIGSARNGS